MHLSAHVCSPLWRYWSTLGKGLPGAHLVNENRTHVECKENPAVTTPAYAFNLHSQREPRGVIRNSRVDRIYLVRLE